MELQKIVGHLTDTGFRNDISDLILGCSMATDSQREQMLSEFDKEISSYLQQLEDIKDVEEIPVSLALKYIETKCRWINLNTQINYRLMRTGEPMELEMYQASVLSHILMHLEHLLPADDLQAICEFLTQPVKGGSTQ